MCVCVCLCMCVSVSVCMCMYIHISTQFALSLFGKYGAFSILSSLGRHIAGWCISKSW